MENVSNNFYSITDNYNFKKIGIVYCRLSRLPNNARGILSLE